MSRAEKGRSRRPRRIDENLGLQALVRLGSASQREDDIKQEVDSQAPRQTLSKRCDVRSEQRRRPQGLDGERAIQHEGRGMRKDGGQSDRVETNQKSRDRATDCAACGAAPPNHPDQCRWCDLHNADERAETDRRERRAACGDGAQGRECHDRDNRDAPDRENGRPVEATSGKSQHDRHRHVVAHHDRERLCRQKDHRRPGRKSTNQREQRDEALAGVDRQRQDRDIAIDRAIREDRETRRRDGEDEHDDGQNAERHDPGRGSHVRLVVILDDRNLKLLRHDEGRRHDGGD